MQIAKGGGTRELKRDFIMKKLKKEKERGELEKSWLLLFYYRNLVFVVLISY